MWPWGHLAVGYLLYSVYSHLRHRLPPDGLAALAVALGTQFPDLVDKPLAWTFHVLPSGRSFAHSVWMATAMSLLGIWLARRYDRSDAGLAFAIGYYSHLVADGIEPFLRGDFSKLTYLGWPVTPSPDYGVEHGFVYHFTHMTVSPFFVFQIGLGVLVVGLWLRDGAPGVGTLRFATQRAYERLA